MYEMYPDAWTVVEEPRPVRPRRRPRKAHPVLPAVIAHQTAERQASRAA